VVTAAASWFGPEDRPLFGWMHSPDDARARAGVVVCPPLGLEAVCAHRTLRHVAERLAAAGLAALRIDYDGTGDSAGGEDDPGRVAAWVESVRSAVAFVRSTGAEAVVVVGMRLGATLAAAALAGRDIAEGLVLWDPCPSGRSYLREQQALGLFSTGGGRRDDGSVEVPGVVYGRSTVAELEELSVADLESPLAKRVLVLLRPDRAANKKMVARLENDGVEWGTASGQGELVDVEPFLVREPVAAADEVVGWVTDLVEGGGPKAEFAVPAGRERIVLAGGVAERIVGLGPMGLFGIISGPAGNGDGAEPGAKRTVVLLNAGVIDHTGPSRLWVEFARQWAGAGVRVVRFDLSGVGDSPVREGQPEDEMYPPEALDDLGDVVRALSSSGGADVILAGLCSGGYHSVEGGIALGVPSVCLINPILTARPGEVRGKGGGLKTPDVDPRRQATTARRKWVRMLPAHDKLGKVGDRLPDLAWWFINRLLVKSPPARIMERLVDAGVDTYVVCGVNEARWMRRGQAAAFRRLARSGRFHLEVMSDIDHELFARASRDLVGPVVTERILSSASSGVRPATTQRRGTPAAAASADA
jgi:alpha-beta hydrolase superfamily lysophospholipase